MRTLFFSFAMAAAVSQPVLADDLPKNVIRAPLIQLEPLPDQQQEIEAAKLWQSGEPAKVVAAYAKLGFEFPKQGLWRDRHRVFVSDWIVALTYSDPAAAMTKLEAWEQVDPFPIVSLWAARRLVLRTRILTERKMPDMAKAAINAATAEADRVSAILEAEEKHLKKSGVKGPFLSTLKVISDLNNPGETSLEALATTRRVQRSAAFLLATHRKGELAFPDYSNANTSPFVGKPGRLFLNRRNSQVACAANDLVENDWAIFDISLSRNAAGGTEVLVRPFAGSRFAAMAPFLAQVKRWDITVKNRATHDDRMPVMLRCFRSNGPPSKSPQAYQYLFNVLKAQTKELGPDYVFSEFRQPLTDLARDGQWTMLMNIADRVNPHLPEAQGFAQKLVLQKLQAAEKLDPVAIAIVEYMMLPELEPGNTFREKRVLPAHIAFVERMRTSNILPPRILAEFELQLASQHEVNSDPLAAGQLYKIIVERPALSQPVNTPEYLIAQLRLAALADSAGRKAESKAIFAKIGFSPDQCVLFQSHPTAVSVTLPEYSGWMIRLKAEGKVELEFDLDTGGAATNFRVTQSAPPLIFDEKTIDSFRRARFAPVVNGTEATACKGAVQSIIWKMPED